MSKPQTEIVISPVDSLAELSSGHIPQATAVALGEEPKNHHKSALFSSLAYTPWADYGWIIHCSVESALAVQEGHPELSNLIDRCANAGITWLKLDADGPLIEGLPSFDW